MRLELMTRIVFKIDIARSAWILGYLIALHTLMLVMILSVLGISFWALFALVALVFSLMCYCRQYQWLHSQHSIIKLERDAGGLWNIVYSGNKEKQKLVLNNSVVMPQLVMMYFKAPTLWQRSAVTIMADAVDANSFRQLRIYLRAPKTFQQ